MVTWQISTIFRAAIWYAPADGWTCLLRWQNTPYSAQKDVSVFPRISSTFVESCRDKSAKVTIATTTYLVTLASLYTCETVKAGIKENNVRKCPQHLRRYCLGITHFKTLRSFMTPTLTKNSINFSWHGICIRQYRLILFKVLPLTIACNYLSRLSDERRDHRRRVITHALFKLRKYIIRGTYCRFEYRLPIHAFVPPKGLSLNRPLDVSHSKEW